MISTAVPDLSESAKTALITGGLPLEVKHRQGLVAQVVVRLLPMSELPRYQAIVENEAEVVALFCGRDSAWADSLTPESFSAVLATGEGLNLDPLSSFLARQRERRKKLLPNLEEIEERVARMIAGGALPAANDTSPKS